MADADHEPRFRLFETLLARFAPGKLIDLGTGHGRASHDDHEDSFLRLPRD